MNTVVSELLEFIARPTVSDDDFNTLALKIFAHQFEHNRPFQKFCQGRGKTPRVLKNWRDIPAVPINAFKELTLSCVPPDTCARTFMTSGTTRGDVKGRHFHPTMAVYDASMLRNFAQHVMQGDAQLRMGILFPDEVLMPNSSLAHYLALAIDHFGTPDSAYYLDENGLRTNALCEALQQSQDSGQPFALLGASYSFVHLMDALSATGLSLAFGVMRFVNLAHGDIAILAAFVAFSLTGQGLSPAGAIPSHALSRRAMPRETTSAIGRSADDPGQRPARRHARRGGAQLCESPCRGAGPAGGSAIQTVSAEPRQRIESRREVAPDPRVRQSCGGRGGRLRRLQDHGGLDVHRLRSSQRRLRAVIPVAAAKMDASVAPTSATECAADNVMRKRAVPTGTVGARMAVIHKPCACNAAEALSASALLPMRMG